MSSRHSWIEFLTGPHHLARQPVDWVAPADETEYTLGLIGAGVDLAGHDDPLFAGLAQYAGDVRTHARLLAPPPLDDLAPPPLPVLTRSDLRGSGDGGPTVITLTDRTPPRSARHGRGQRRSLAVAASVAAIVLAMSGTALAVADHQGSPSLSSGPSQPTAASAAASEVSDLLSHASYLLTAAVHATPGQQAALRGEASQDLAHARSLLPDVTQGQVGFSAALAKLQGQTGLPAIAGGTGAAPSSAPQPHSGGARPTTHPTTFPYRGIFSFDNPAGHGHFPTGHPSTQSAKGYSAWPRIPGASGSTGGTTTP